MMYAVYGRPNCPWCDKAKALLQERGLAFNYYDIYEHGLVEWIKGIGVKTVPQIYKVSFTPLKIEWIGGYENLVAHLQVEDADNVNDVYAGRLISD